MLCDALARRRKHERSAAISECEQPIDGATWDRWQAIAHEEVDRLPDSLRTPFVLCVMQGVRQTEAAERLGWKTGTVSARVCKAKQAIAESLARRGLTGAIVFGAALGGATGPLTAALIQKGSIVATGATELSKTIHELARGAMGGLMSKTKLLAAAAVVATLTIGVGTKVLSTAEAQPETGAAGEGADRRRQHTQGRAVFSGRARNASRNEWNERRQEHYYTED
jgi:hypothetical protein